MGLAGEALSVKALQSGASTESTFSSDPGLPEQPQMASAISKPTTTHTTRVTLKLNKAFDMVASCFQLRSSQVVFKIRGSNENRQPDPLPS